MAKIDKEGYYFPHFSNARNDRKVKRLRKEMQVEGYGIFMMLLEILRDQPDLRYPIADIDLLETEIGTSQAKIEAVVNRYDLFHIDSQHFFSPKLIEYLEPYFNVREQRSLAGKKSGEARRLKALNGTAAEQPLNNRSSTVEQGEESKVNQTKENGSRKRFTPPCLDEVHDYVGNKQLAERFTNYYQSNGWMVGKNKMKDWQATARNWMSKESGTLPNGQAKPVATSPNKILVDENGRRIYGDE